MTSIIIAKCLLSTAKEFYDTWNDRRRDRAQQRIEQLQGFLRRRVENIEDKLDRIPDSDSDIFMAAVDALMREDEDGKTAFYAVFLEELLTTDTDRTQLRLVANALKTLTALELEHLATFEDLGPTVVNPPDWLVPSLRSRLHALGLHKGAGLTSYGPSSFTTIGMLAKRIAQRTLSSYSAMRDGKGVPNGGTAT